MTDWCTQLQQFVDSIAASVAVVATDEAGQLIVPACNNIVFDMMGGRPIALHEFPMEFDALVPSYARREFHDSLRECFRSGIAQELEQAYDLKEDTRWWRLSLKPFRHTEDSGAVLEILVTGLDITPKMELTHQLEISTSRFRLVVDAAYDAIITIDEEHNVTLFNRAAENLFGYDASEMIGQPLLRLIPEPYRTKHDAYVHHFARSPVNSRQMNERNRIHGLHRDGSLLPVEIAISKINVGGHLEFTAIVRDIADQVRLMNLLRKQAVTDQLTGLPNRREFLEVMDQCLGSSEVLSVLMLDIDHFKTVNDTYGHDAGDEVLSVLAKVGTAVTSKVGVFARWGGEEFAVALPHADLEQARAIAEQLRLTIANQDFKHEWRSGQTIAFTVSIGVATRAAGESDTAAILKRADEALYKAKEKGRNQVMT